MSDKDTGKLERIKMHLADAKAREFYAIQRIDLLVISISGAGIYIVFETLKFMLQQRIALNPSTLEWGGVCFVLATLLNFASQWAGYYTNKHEACWAQFEHKRLGGACLNDKEAQEQKDHDTAAHLAGIWTRRFNLASTLAMLVGMVLLLVFNLTSFGAVVPACPHH
ncbi:MAG: hypothetical protein JNL05_10495 [Flavobacteriales bacterium]|nr:hypothetical protein [Flavobacteriales bacterium]